MSRVGAHTDDSLRRSLLSKMRDVEDLRKAGVKGEKLAAHVTELNRLYAMWKRRMGI